MHSANPLAIVHSFTKFCTLLGEIYLKKQEYENARVEFTNVVDSGDPTLAPLANFGIAQTHLAEGTYEEAVAAYQTVIDLHPDSKAGQDRSLL